MAATVPLAIDLAARRLRVTWDDGVVDTDAGALRAACHCAGCRAPGAVPSTAPVTLADVRPVGDYAVQLVFSDGHDSGIYPWQLLRSLAQSQVQAQASSS